MISQSFLRNYSWAKISKTVQQEKVKLKVLYVKTINKIIKVEKQKQKLSKQNKLNTHGKRYCQSPQILYRYTYNIIKSEQLQNQFLNQSQKENVHNGRKKVPIIVKSIQISKNQLKTNKQSRIKASQALKDRKTSDKQLIARGTVSYDRSHQSFFNQCPLKSVEIMEKNRRQFKKTNFQKQEKSLTQNIHSSLNFVMPNLLIPRLKHLKQQELNNSSFEIMAQVKKSLTRKNPRSSRKSIENKQCNMLKNLQNSMQISLKKSKQRGYIFQNVMKRKYRQVRQTHKFNQRSNSQIEQSER